MRKDVSGEPSVLVVGTMGMRCPPAVNFSRVLCVVHPGPGIMPQYVQSA